MHTTMKKCCAVDKFTFNTKDNGRETEVDDKPFIDSLSGSGDSSLSTRVEMYLD